MQVRNLIVGALLFSCTGHVNAQSLTLRVDNIDQIVDSMTLEEKVNQLLTNKEIYQNKMKNSQELKSVADFYELLKKDLS